MKRFAFEMLHRACVACLVVLGLPFQAAASNIVPADVTATLGPDFFFDQASTGGNDNSASVFTREINGYWSPQAQVALLGLGWASSASGTEATSVTVTFTDLGPDNALGTPDDVVVGSETGALMFSGAGEYAWQFDSPITFTATGSGLGIQIEGFANGVPANIRRKTASGSSQDSVKLSLAGTAEGGVPLPASYAATDSGLWDGVVWSTGAKTVIGDLPENDTATIGNYRTVTFRGSPESEIIHSLTLGDAGHGTLVITSGVFQVTAGVTVGRGQSYSDGFLRVQGGTLLVNGNGDFGRLVAEADGTLEVSGGTAAFSGDLNMGAFAKGGALLRLRNPGSAPAVQVGGTLLLGRCVLGLTFDDRYVHSPGTTINVVEYAARDGQFGNFRQGDEFNSGPNRFRINYDVDAGDGRKKITLTALQNWPVSKGPNIILMLADDQGSADLRLYGDDRFPMPRLETMASSGVKFTQAYVTGGVCHPTRCAMLTGTYQQRFGTDNNPDSQPYTGLAISQRTIPQRLQGLGYRTYGIAKWHLGNTVDYHPVQRGFDRWYGINAGSRSYWNASGEENEFQDDEIPRPQDEGEYVTDRVGNACTNFIAEHLANYGAEQPFFIYVAFTAVHGPVDIDTPPGSKPTDPRYARLLNEFGLDESKYGPPEVIFGNNAATTQKNRYDLAAMTLALDENVGKILDMLEATGLSTNTLVVYMNDNGGAGWSSGSGGNYSYNRPLRGYKGGSMTEGSIRVPAVAAWPGTIPGPQVISTPVISLDFLATFVNAGGAPPQARNGLEGLDLLPLLRKGEPLPTERTLFWRAGGVTGMGSAARKGDWKLLGDDANRIFRLYNLAQDAGETTDLSAQHPDIYNELFARFLAWDAANITPLYSSGGISTDPDLERHGITSGYRVYNRSAAPAFLTGALRNPVSMQSDFRLGFHLRPTETNHAPGAQLWFVLGKGAARGDLIRAGIDFGSGQLRLVEGSTGLSMVAVLPVVPDRFESAVLTYEAAAKRLSFSCGGTNVSLILNGSYGALDTYGCGATAMEGEVTQPVLISPGTNRARILKTELSSDTIRFVAQLETTHAPSPVLTRAASLESTFEEDPQALIESLGGGVYQFTALRAGAERGFLRPAFTAPQ